MSNAAKAQEAREAITLVLFRDQDAYYRHEGDEFNKSGYLTLSGSIIHLQGLRLVESTKARIQRWPHRERSVPLSAAECEAAEFLFTRKRRDPTLFSAALHALMNGHLLSLAKCVRPAIFEVLSEEERENRWNRLLGAARCGDLIFTLNTGSWLSRTIAWVDNGPWSHTAFYLGEGEIHEAITSGVCVRSINVYRAPNFRVGLYRVPMPEGQPRKGMDRIRSDVGGKYSYRKALLVGAEKLLCFKRTIPTPNDLLMIPGLELIAVV